MDKYKVGDTVVIKSLDWFNLNKRRVKGTIAATSKDSKILFTRAMSIYCGKRAKILSSQIDSSLNEFLLKIDRDGKSFNWRPYMFEDDVEEKVKNIEEGLFEEIERNSCPAGDYMYSSEECISLSKLVVILERRKLI